MKTVLGNAILVMALLGLAGCGSVPLAPQEQDAASKQFKLPAKDMAGIYIYRNGSYGGSAKKLVKIDDVIIGETVKETYFHREVKPGAHVIATNSEFGDNSLSFNADPGRNYYFRQYIKLGVFSAGADIEAVTDAVGKRACWSVTKLANLVLDALSFTKKALHPSKAFCFGVNSTALPSWSVRAVSLRRPCG